MQRCTTLGRGRFEHALARQVDTALAVDLGDPNDHLVAELHLVFDAIHAMRSEMQDVHETFFDGQDLHEGTEVHDPFHDSGVHFADFDVARNVFHHALRLLAGIGVRRRDEYAPVVFDVDLGAGLGDDLVDDLAAWADDVFDLVGMDLQHEHAGCELGEAAPRSGNRFAQLVDDEQAALTRLFHGPAHDIDRDAADLDVHLHRGDAVHRAGDFEVHLAERVFEALDIAQNSRTAVFENQAHGDPADVLAQRHARIHEREGRSAHRTH